MTTTPDTSFTNLAVLMQGPIVQTRVVTPRLHQGWLVFLKGSFSEGRLSQKVTFGVTF